MALTEAEELELLELEEQEAQASHSSPEQSGSGFLDTLSNAADRVTSTIPAATGLMAPTLGMAQYAGQKINEAAGGLAGPVTEAIATKYPNLPTAVPVAAGIGASIFGNPMTYVDPGVIGSGRVAKPVAPAGRQVAVSAAERIGMPMRRGEITGSKFSTGLSNFMEKTVLGSGPEDAFTARQYGALGAEKARLQGKLGNMADTYAVGQQAQRGVGKREAAMASQKNAMFEAIPENVNIPLNKARSVADTIIQEQSQYLPTTRNSDIIAIAKDVQSAETSSGKGVIGGPDKFGETISVSPEKTFEQKHNYQQLKRLREVVGGKAQDAKNAGKFAEARDYQRLKHAIDEDIDAYVGGQTSPLGSMVAKEFSESYRKANAFSGAYKGLFKSDEAQSLLQAPPEKVVDIVFKKNNESAIKQFRALAGEEGFLPAKQKFTQELLDSNNVSKELSKYEPGTLRSIYNAQELKELTDYGLAQGIPKTVPGMQGTQGSARSNIAAGQYTGLGAGLISLLSGNVIGAAIGVGQFVAPAAVSRLNLHYAGGVPASFGRASTNISKFGVLGTTMPSNTRRAIMSELIDRITIGKQRSQ